MIKKISIFLTNKIIENNHDMNIDFDLYQYGIEILIHKFLYTITLCIFCLFNPEYIIPSLLFTFSYFNIRKHTGGFHANSMVSCLIIFLIMYFLLIGLLNKNITITPYIFYLLTITNLIIISLLSPIDCSNKRLNNIEKQQNKKKSFYISMIWSIISIIFFNFYYLFGYLPILFTCINISVFLILGYCFPK